MWKLNRCFEAFQALNRFVSQINWMLKNMRTEKRKKLLRFPVEAWWSRVHRTVGVRCLTVGAVQTEQSEQRRDRTLRIARTAWTRMKVRFGVPWITLVMMGFEQFDDFLNYRMIRLHLDKKLERFFIWWISKSLKELLWSYTNNICRIPNVISILILNIYLSNI